MGAGERDQSHPAPEGGTAQHHAVHGARGGLEPQSFCGGPEPWVLGPGREMNHCRAWGSIPGQNWGLRTSWVTSGKSMTSEPLFFSSVYVSMMLGNSDIT